MAQVFDRGLVLALKVGTLVLVVLLATLLASWRWSIAPPHAQGAAPPQPLPFSHQHHVRDDGIDCRYCHAGVEKSAFAGMPGSNVCLTCHSQLFRDSPLFAPLHASARDGRRLQWTRVNDLPDFVYFDHSAHVTHGVPCKECHGRIDQMPLTARARSLEMQWCLGCHRDTERRAQLAHYDVLSRKWLTDCSTCHR